MTPSVLDKLMEDLFREKPPPTPVEEAGLKESEIETLACSISEAWKRFRVHEEKKLGSMDPLLVSRLDDLEELTRGNILRCSCLTYRDSGGERHDIRCSGRKPGE